MRNPLISVVVPAYNAEAWILDAVESVRTQTYTNWELVVVDDGSTDNTSDLVATRASRCKQRIRLESLSHRGVSAARNVGARLAEGEALAFLDADDVWYPGKLESQIRFLLNHPNLDGVGCGFEAVSCDLGQVMSRYNVSWSPASIRSWLLLESHGVLLPSTLLIRKSTFMAVGEFNESLSTAADLDLAWRLAQQAVVGDVGECLVQYRRCSGQMHRDIALLLHDYSILMHLYPDVFDERTRRRVHFNLRLLDALRRAKEKGLVVHLPSLLRLLVENPAQSIRWSWMRSRHSKIAQWFLQVNSLPS